MRKLPRFFAPPDDPNDPDYVFDPIEAASVLLHISPEAVQEAQTVQSRNRRFTLITYVPNGFGDLMNGVELLILLKKQDSSLIIHWIIIKPDNKALEMDMILSEYPELPQPHIVSIENEKTNEDTAKNSAEEDEDRWPKQILDIAHECIKKNGLAPHDLGYVLFFPFVNSSGDIDSLVTYWQELWKNNESGIPLFSAVYEYEIPDEAKGLYQTTGYANKNSLGVSVPDENEISNRDLNYYDESLRTLMAVCDHQFYFSYIGEGLQTESMKGYGTVSNFIRIIDRLNQNDQKSIFLLAKNFNSAQWEGLVLDKPIKTVDIDNVHQLSGDDYQGKIIIVTFSKFIHPHDFDLLIRNAHSPIMGTGDRTISYILGFIKTLFPEVMRWKTMSHFELSDKSKELDCKNYAKLLDMVYNDEVMENNGHFSDDEINKICELISAIEQNNEREIIAEYLQKISFKNRLMPVVEAGINYACSAPFPDPGSKGTISHKIK